MKITNLFSNIKAIAFDFWGVFAELRVPMYEFMQQHKIPKDKFANEIHNFVIEHDLGKLTEQEFLQKCSKMIGLEIPYSSHRYTFQEELLNKSLIETVDRLKKKYKIALLSNNNKEYCKEFLFKPELDKLFDVMIISYQVGFRKPAPEIYQILIKKLDVQAEEILFIDDDPTKLPAAEAQGLKTLVYKNKETDILLLSLL